MQTKPSDPGYAQGGNAQSQFVYVPMDMLQKMMSSNPVNNVQVQGNMIPGQQGKPKCINCGRDGHLKQNCFMAGSGKEGQWPARNNSHIKCFKCQKMGHYSRECKEQGKAPEVAQLVNSMQEEMAEENFFAGVMEDKELSENEGNFFGVMEDEEPPSEDICVYAEEQNKVEEFLIDSGATCHVTYNDEGMKNMVPSKSIIQMGDESRAEVAALGDLNLRVYNTSVVVMLKPINYVPSFKKHIISVSRLCKDGYEVTITDQECRIKTIQGGCIIIKKSRDGMFYLDVTRKNNGFVMSAIEKEAEIEETVEDEVGPEDEEHQMKEAKQVRFQESKDINELHDQLGHVSEGIIQRLMKHLGIGVNGKLRPCEACALHKAKQKPLKKVTKNRANEVGGRMFMDMSGPFHPTIGGSRYWVLVVDDFSRMGFCGFLKEKSQLASWMMKKKPQRLKCYLSKPKLLGRPTLVQIIQSSRVGIRPVSRQD